MTRAFQFDSDAGVRCREGRFIVVLAWTPESAFHTRHFCRPIPAGKAVFFSAPFLYHRDYI